MMKIFSLFCRTDSFQEQIEQIRPKLYRLAYSWSHNAALADDLVQDALAKALKNANQLRDPALLNSWLFSIMVNCWRDHFRKHREMEDIDEFDDIEKLGECGCVVSITPEDEHAQSQIVFRVRAAVARLPMGQRQVLTLVDLEEFSYAEVAAILTIPIGTVMSRLCRARQLLKILLKELAPEQSEQVSRIRRVM